MFEILDLERRVIVLVSIKERQSEADVRLCFRILCKNVGFLMMQLCDSFSFIFFVCIYRAHM